MTGTNIDCGSTCASVFNRGYQATLTASPAAGSFFAGWTGACSGSSTCVVSLASATSVTATFTLASSSSTPIATINGIPMFPRIFYDSGESSNFADQSVANLNLGRFGMTHYLNYQYGAPYQKAVSQLTPLSQLGMYGFATGNAFGVNTVETMSSGNGNFAVVTNVPAPTTPFRQLFPGLSGAGGVYLADEVNQSLLSNVLLWRNTYHTDMPTMPALIVLLPEGPLTPETAVGSGVESQFGSVGFTEHLLSVANPYWWMRNLPVGGNDWVAEDPYPVFRPETTPGASGGVLEQGGYPHYWVADRAAHVVAAARQNGKVPLLILQLFAPFGGSRLITPNEMWQHAIMAVAEGIRGLGWWQIGTNGGLRDQAEPARTNLENALINITQFLKNNEATILTDPILGRFSNSTATGNALQWRKTALVASANGSRQTSFGDGGRGSYQAELNALNAGVTQWSPMLDQSGDVRHRVFRIGTGNNYLVFAYNYAPTARTGVIFTADLPVASVTVVDEGRTITPAGATWTDNFGGASSLTQGANRNAHIYQVTLIPAVQTALHTAALSVSAKGWSAPITMTNSATVLGGGSDTCNNGNIFTFVKGFVPDPINDRIYIYSSSHNSGAQFVGYEGSNNTWTTLTNPPFSNAGCTCGGSCSGQSAHAYNNWATDLRTGNFYGSPPTGGQSVTIHKYTPGTTINNGTWSDLPSTSINFFQNPCCWPITYFSGMGLLLYNGGTPGGGRALKLYPEKNLGTTYTAGSWATVITESSNGSMDSGSGQIDYNEVVDCALAGGGDAQTVFWKICRGEDGSPVVTQVPAPSSTNSTLAIRVPNSILTHDPVSGCFLILTSSGSSPTLWENCGVSWRANGSWTQVVTSIPAGVTGGSSCTSGGNPLLCETTAYPLHRYGGVLFIGCDSAGSQGPATCRQYFYKHNDGGGTNWIVDFQRRIRDTNVVRWFNFPTQDRLCWPDATACGAIPSAGSTTKAMAESTSTSAIITADTSFPTSGPASMKMTQRSQTSARAAGTFRMNATPDTPNQSATARYTTTFGPSGDIVANTANEFWIQWRQRFSTGFTTQNFGASAQGWKQFHVGWGDRNTFSLFPSGVTPVVSGANDCTQGEIVFQNTNQRGIPQLYNSCGSRAGAHYEPLDATFSGQIRPQYSATDVPNCIYPNFVTGCIQYAENEWLTFKIHVKVTAWWNETGSDPKNSIVEAWMGRQGQPLKKIMERSTTSGAAGGWGLPNHQGTVFPGDQFACTWASTDLSQTPVPGCNYSKLILQVYHEGKDSSLVHPDFNIWYADLIWSRADIPDPN